MPYTGTFHLKGPLCPEQGTDIISSESVQISVWTYPRQGMSARQKTGVVLHMEGIFKVIFVPNRIRVSNPQGYPYTQKWVKYPPSLGEGVMAFQPRPY